LSLPRSHAENENERLAQFAQGREYKLI
jgi:hypothetical protein